MSRAVHATCFDALALVKRYVDEPGSDALRAYWRSQATRYTTPFCLYETLSALNRHKIRGALTKDAYLNAASDLVAWFRASQSSVRELDFTESKVFLEAKELAEDSDLDLSDASSCLPCKQGSSLC
jgi:predicted nucleic acid-binding protein